MNCNDLKMILPEATHSLCEYFAQHNWILGNSDLHWYGDNSYLSSKVLLYKEFTELMSKFNCTERFFIAIIRNDNAYFLYMAASKKYATFSCASENLYEMCEDEIELRIASLQRTFLRNYIP